jgi:hypothetical protein
MDGSGRNGYLLRSTIGNAGIDCEFYRHRSCVADWRKHDPATHDPLRYSLVSKHTWPRRSHFVITLSFSTGRPRCRARMVLRLPCKWNNGWLAGHCGHPCVLLRSSFSCFTSLEHSRATRNGVDRLSFNGIYTLRGKHLTSVVLCCLRGNSARTIPAAIA